jgi:uncharacterized protein
MMSTKAARMRKKAKRGFSAMDPEKRRAIASKGGSALHAKGTAHKFTSEEARVAGSKGGRASARNRARKRSVSSEC